MFQKHNFLLDVVPFGVVCMALTLRSPRHICCEKMLVFRELINKGSSKGSGPGERGVTEGEPHSADVWGPNENVADKTIKKIICKVIVILGTFPKT